LFGDVQVSRWRSSARTATASTRARPSGVPLAADDLHGAADCFAQLHSATSSTPCPGQEPSKIVPLSSTTDNGGDKANTFVAVAGKRMHSSTSPAECTSAFLYDYFHKHPFFDYFHKKPQGPEPKPDPKPTPLPANGGGGGAGNGGGGAEGNSGGAAPSPSSPPVYH
jgi:hypothetical protein